MTCFYQDHLQIKALEVLNVYLTESPVSVLQKEFVEIEDPLCTGKDCKGFIFVQGTYHEEQMSISMLLIISRPR